MKPGAIIGVVGNYKNRLAFARMIIKANSGKYLVLPLLELPQGTRTRYSFSVENRAMTRFMFSLRKNLPKVLVVWSANLASKLDKRLRILTDEIWLVDKMHKGLYTVWKYDRKTGEVEKIAVTSYGKHPELDK